MLKKLLIANRGEIACRIIRTTRRMEVATVAVYSDADAKAMHVQAADEAVHIGPSPATESYLRIDKIIAAAKATGADAIHPGYGFLSENADLPEACVKAGLIFVGPTAAAMRALGGKAAAKDIAIKAGVPVVPGYQGAAQDLKTLKAAAKRIGYPVMIKAVAGGGGRGMRLVDKDADFASLLDSAQREAASAFGNPDVLIEKFVVAPRHIEVQVFGDSHGNVVHLFERDCTLQRRNQKVIEEAPAPGMSAQLREQMCSAAVKLAKSVGYAGAGTVEFLVEGGKLDADAPWYFIEMNTRLQVEHPVTEEITGLDLVEWQLRVASGETLPKAQGEIAMHGHSIEVRLCAEDPAKGFMPSVGPLPVFGHREFAPRTRLETGVRAGDAVSPYYDSMIAKLIVHGSDRTAALDSCLQEMGKLEIAGVQTNIRFLANLLGHPSVRTGAMDTGLIGRDLATLGDSTVSREALTAAFSALVNDRARWASTNRAEVPNDGDPWATSDAFQLGPRRANLVTFDVGAERRAVRVSWIARTGAGGMPQGFEPHVALAGWDAPSVTYAGSPFSFILPRSDGAILLVDRGVQVRVSWPTYDINEVADGSSLDVIRAPINGRLAKIFVAVGDSVAKGDRVAVVEAMKMEHVLAAARDGTIAKVAATEGAQVTQGTLIATLAEV
jgi:3-methylcrotonyl-CoA carboxylase alpha subunit